MNSQLVISYTGGSFDTLTGRYHVVIRVTAFERKTDTVFFLFMNVVINEIKNTSTREFFFYYYYYLFAFTVLWEVLFMRISRFSFKRCLVAYKAENNLTLHSFIYA